ncbi:MAG: L-seryl-tRNA(Sec) selenium transferase [Deltaproteobacteria bacterium]|nr:L-seryl-tRNA(Sec) selenium transferase [Deltaproteobacteria bacterium]
MDASSELRKLPKIDRLLDSDEAGRWVEREGRELVLGSLRLAVDEARLDVQQGLACPSEEAILARTRELLDLQTRPTLRPVINATGVVIHTNLGRAPLSEDALAAMARVARGYSNLEFDLLQGERGSRYAHCASLLAKLSGAEAALVVNNNAAAVMLALAALARGREAIVSRGQLVEIGGGFRIPDVMRESGASLVEVGTTNRTYARDFEAAITERTAALMVVHRSNFQMVGFTCDAGLDELAALSVARGLVLIDDLGSGTFLDTAPFGLAHEPTVQERVAAGADLVCFSGDKLLGGPQAGYLVGKRALIERLESFPLLRALRVDKATLAGIEATLRHYQRGEALSKVPVWRAISLGVDAAQARARAWMERLGQGGAHRDLQVVASESTVGGGSLPGLSLPTRVLSVGVKAPDEVARALRLGEPAVVGRIEEGRLVLDPRTVLPHEDDALIHAVQKVLTQHGVS